MSLIGQVALSAAWVAGQARHVKIRNGKIAEYTRSILSKYPVTTEMGQDCHYISGDVEKTAAYILALDSINFGSGYFRLAREAGVDLEYRIIAGGLKKAFERGENWMEATPEWVSRILSIPQGRHEKVDELLDLFAAHLRETAEIVSTAYQGRVLNLLEESGYSAAALADTVAAWRGFHDVHAYKGRDIPILKRAQILAADMNLALSKKIKDIDKLTIFADNMVPHVLRCDGILEYDAALALKIDNGVFIPSGSEEEIEIRTAAIHVVELMKQAADGNVTSVNLDHMLWKRGYEPDLYKRPTHRTLTTDY